MKKPEIKLVDFNSKIPNIQNKGFNNGIPNGRIVVTAKEVSLNDWLSNGVWDWKIKYDNFNLGTHSEHDEIWGFNKEHRKLGGTFPAGYSAVKFYFEVSRYYVNKSGQKKFTWNFTWTQAEGFKEIVESVPTPSPVVPEPIKPDPKPEGVLKTPFIGFSAKSKIILLLISALSWKNWNMIMSHAFGGFLEDLECLTAEWVGVIRMSLKKILLSAVRYEIYLLPVKSKAQIQNAEAYLAKTEGAKYNRYKHVLWALNIGTVFALIGFIPITILGYLKLYSISLAILYLPVRLFLKYKTKNTYDCIHHASGFAKCFDVDLLNGEKTNSLSPDVACEKFQFANKHSDGKLFPLYKKK